jgi:alpha-L-fucosidase
MAKTIKEIDEMIKLGPFSDSWESLQEKSISKWFKRDKFGIFIHWGLYSIPAFKNEWYPRNMYIEGSEEYYHHLKTYGEHKNFGYKDFIPLFKAENFNPKKWVEIIKSSGAKYLVQVAEHHDGFQMYKSEVSKWNTFDMDPKRDILSEVRDECEKEGLKFGVSSHRAEHWFFLSHGRKFPSDIGDDLKEGDFYWPSEPEQDNYDFSSQPSPNKEFLEDWLRRTVEIIDKLNPKILYFDWWVQHEAFKPYLKKVAAYYYNHGYHQEQEVIICYKHDAFAYGTGVIEIERGRFNTLKHFPWQTETSIANNSWAYTNDLDYKTTNELICLLIDVVSKNGNLLLNIGPKADGTIPEYEVNVLKKIGDWLKINGEAIYKSIPYHTFGEGPTVLNEGMFSEKAIEYTNKDFRFTVNNGVVYVLILNPSQTNIFTIKTLGKANKCHRGIYSNVKRVILLETKEAVDFKQDNDALDIKLSNNKHNKPIVFKVTIE